jgi:hypothetical protein
MTKTLYMVVEHFKRGDAVAVYRRFRDRGRLAPPGLTCLSSWVDRKFERCYQLMETDDPQLLDDWIANWSDIVDFEVYPVITSAEAAERIASRHCPYQQHRPTADGSRSMCNHCRVRNSVICMAVNAYAHS